MIRCASVLLALFLFFTSLTAVTVGRIDFNGNRVFPDRELLKVVTTRIGDEYDAAKAVTDSHKLSDYYAKHGYYFAEVDYPQVDIPDPKHLILTFDIREQRDRSVDSVRFVGNRYFSEYRLREMLGANGRKSLDQLSALITDTVDLYASRGFLFAEAELDTVAYTPTGIAAVVRITEGPICRPKTYHFEGNRYTKGSSLLRIARAETGMPLSYAALTKMQDRIARKDYIKNCEIRPLDAQNVLVKVDEGHMTKLSGLFGYDNKAVNKKLTGWIDLEFLNLFGTDRALTFYWQSLATDRSTVKLTYHESGPFSFPLAGDFSLSRETVDSTYIHSVVSADVYYETLFQRFGTTFGVDDIYPGNRRPQTIDTDLRKTVGLFYEWDSVDFWANPGSGTTFDVRWTEIFRSTDTGASHIPTTVADFIHYQPLPKNFVFMAGIHGKNSTEKDLADYDAFKLGGNKNLRGFQEDFFSGYRVGWATLELRYLTARTSRVFLFFDSGYVEQKESGEVHRLSELLGYGLGMAIQTTVGVFVLDYALSDNEGDWRSPVDGIVHFGFETQL